MKGAKLTKDRLMRNFCTAGEFLGYSRLVTEEVAYLLAMNS